MKKIINSKIYFIQKIIYLLFCLILFYSTRVDAQKLMTINSIMDSIKIGNPSFKMYDADIRSMDEAAKGAKSWMPPEVSTGLWMVPYNTRLWKKGDMGATGMGQYMLGGQQMFPNKKKQNADAAYMEAMSSVTKERKNATLNELINDAKKFYYEWIIIEKKLVILEQNEKLIDFMIKNAEIRYKNGLEKISAYYKAKAALGNLLKPASFMKNTKLVL